MFPRYTRQCHARIAIERRGFRQSTVRSELLYPLSGIPRTALDASFDVLARHGNMSSPTVLFILDRLRRADAPRPCVAVAFGPGLTVEAALLA